MSSSKKRYVFMLVYLAYTSIYIARINLSIASPILINGNVLTTIQIGALGSIFSTAFAAGRLINGGLSDSKPPWLMLTVGLCGAGISNILISFFPPFIAIFLLWTLNAYAQSMLWSSVLCVVSAIYSEKTAKKKMTLMVTSVAMGNILGIVVNTILIKSLGERFAFLIPGAITLILGALVLFATKRIENPHSKPAKHIPFFQLLKNREILVATVPAVFHGVMKENVSLWMAVYIIDTFRVDFKTSSYYVLLIPAIGFLGRLIYSLLYKLCRENENSVSVLGFAVCAAASLLLTIKGFGVFSATLFLSIIYAAVSVINTSVISIYPLRFSQSGNAASVCGIMDFATYIGAGVSSAVYGVTIKHFGYLPMFISWIIISLISLFILKKCIKEM